MHRLKGLFKKSAASVAPPIAAQFRPANACPRSISLHNEPPLLDSLSWMNDASSASVRRYVQAENAYTAHVVRDRLAPLANRLQREITDLHRCHLPTATRTPAERIGVFEYFSEQCDSESPRLCRRRINQRNSEQIVIDPVDVKQRWARDSEFFHVAQQKLSSDHRYVAFTFDALGTERYRVRIRDVQTGQYLNDFQDDKIDIGSVEWASKAGAPPVLLYTVIDEEFRSSKVYRHQIGTNHSMDELLWHERDQSVFADVTRTKDNRFALITLNSKSMSEVWTIDTDQPNPKPVLVRSRSAGLEYFVEHAGNGVLVMVTNADGARNYKLVVASVENPGQWFDLLPQDSNGARISEIDVLQNHLIVWQQCDGIPRVRLVSWPASNRVPTFTSLAALPHFDIPLPAGTQVVRGGFNAIDSSAVRLICSSVLESDAVYDFDLQKHTLSRCFGDDDTQKTVVKRAGGSYVCERVNVKSDDGALVPMTIVRRHDAKPNSETPVLLTAYGAYGFPLDLSFDASRFALLDRGWVLAFAHVRGGGERGHSWLATGLNRPRAHEDFEACARWLRTSGWSQPSRIAVQAHSAGGLLLAVAAGRHGRNLFGAMLAHSPFVDVVNAMTLPASESSALSVHERDEWGDMLGDASIWRMWRSLAPLHNMRAAEYPHALITASVHDNRVPVADALKFAAAMREHNQAANTLTLCQINQEEGGHFGSTSFEGRVKQTALEYAFLIHTLQNGKDGSDGKDSKSIA